jgi:hypothetical protein
MLETEIRQAVSADPEALHRIMESNKSVLDEETGIHIEENTLVLLDRVA